MIDPIELLRELQRALDGNSAINRDTGMFTTWVDPSFFNRLKAVACTARPSPPEPATREHEHAILVAAARRRLEDVDQYFRDVASWNANRGKTEGIIDPDPDGQMARCRAYYEEVIRAGSAEVAP